ncbi:Putative membrane protein (fragment) [Burkholderia sp. 8Y]
MAISHCGLPPHTRRNRLDSGGEASTTAPISAYAEEPALRRANRLGIPAYLRIRGGTWQPLIMYGVKYGLSPHTRRNRLRSRTVDSRRRPISAYAEEPHTKEK